MSSFFEDEEIGGVLGMKEFVHSDVFKAMNVGFALDEGEIDIFYFSQSKTDFFPFDSLLLAANFGRNFTFLVCLHSISFCSSLSNSF